MTRSILKIYLNHLIKKSSSSALNAVLAVLILAFGLAGTSYAQNSRDTGDEDIGTISNSPFSRMGMGDLFEPGGSRQQALGGGSAAAPSNDNINLVNPANLYYNRVANLEFSNRLGIRSIMDGKKSQNFGNWTPTHISITVPIASPVTASVGIRQYSAVDYARESGAFVNGDTNSLPYSVTNTGRGSLSHIYLAAGVKVFEGFTAGITGTYWLGTLTTRSLSSVVVDEGGNTVDADLLRTQRFSDIQFKPGVSWRGKIPGTGGLRFGAGFVTDIPTQLVTTNESFLSRITTGSYTSRDTLFMGRTQQVQAPVTWQGGLMVERINNWTLMADLSHTRWDKTSTILQQSPKNTYKASVGLEYLPNVLSNRYLNLVTYRLGARWQQLPYETGGNQLQDYALTAGLGLPLLRKEGRYTRPIINLAVQAGRRGSVAKAGLAENYLNFTMGIVLNDNLWFVRYKID